MWVSSWAYGKSVHRAPWNFLSSLREYYIRAYVEKQKLSVRCSSLYRTLETGGNCGMAKETVYRFRNSVHTHWKKFLLLLSSRVFDHTDHPYYRGFRNALGTTSEMTRNLVWSLIDRFLRELPPIYGVCWLFEWQNNAVSCWRIDR